jgi:hypothetical protein
MAFLIQNIMDEFNLQPLIDQINQVLKATLTSIGLGTSRLANSVLIVRIGNGFEIRFSEYAHFVDSGRGANKKPPPVRAIVDWIERNGIFATNLTTLQLAFAISRSIGKKGIKARPFLDRLSEQVAELIKIHIFEEQKKILLKAIS